MNTLDPGHYFGRPTTRVLTSRVAVVESTYAAGAQLGRHAHARAHFCAVLDGGYEEYLGKSTALRQPGTLTFLPAGCDHAERHLTGGRHLMFEAGDAVLAEVGEVARIPIVPITLAQRSATRLGGKIARELRRPDALTPLMIDTMVMELLGALCRERPAPKPRGDWLVGLREALDSEPWLPHNLASLSGTAGRHPMHVARSFRRRFGVSVGSYLRRQRVLWAAAEIRATDTPIADVSVAAGFSDQSHFSHWCRRYVGLSPSQLRRR